MPRYSLHRKLEYIRLCRKYNRLTKAIAGSSVLYDDRLAGDISTFAGVSIALHIAKASVPKKWRTAAFVRSCGM